MASEGWLTLEAADAHCDDACPRNCFVSPALPPPPPLAPFAPCLKKFRAFALRRTGLVSESKNKLQYT
jgi:hypothetical protein